MALSEGDTPDQLLLSGDTAAIKVRAEICINIFFNFDRLFHTSQKTKEAILVLPRPTLQLACGVILLSETM